jgi:polyribonucleotide nucleotidyltransferase
MDIKINGLKWEMVEKALSQAREGRLHILGEMDKAITQPAAQLKPHTPRVEMIVIDKEFIGAVIGPGGKIIQDIQARTGTTISIEERDGRGYVEILSTNSEGMEQAVAIVNGIIQVPEEGTVYSGKVKNIMDFGAFVEFLPGKDGLLHISEIAWERVPTMEGVFKEGDVFDVKLIEVDKKTGKYRLSRKALLPKPEGYVERDRNRGGGGRDRDRGPRN